MNYDIHRYDGHEKKQRLGGAEDLGGAFTLAGAWFSVAQQLYPTTGVGVAVYDDTGALVGTISWVEEEAE
jgi:hypothetical protein